MIPGSLLLELQKETFKKGIELDIDDLMRMRENEDKDEDEDKKEEEKFNNSSDDYFSNLTNMDNDNDNNE